MAGISSMAALLVLKFSRTIEGRVGIWISWRPTPWDIHLNTSVAQWYLQVKSTVAAIETPLANILLVLLRLLLDCSSSLTLQKRCCSLGHFRASPRCPLRHLICVSSKCPRVAHQAGKRLGSAAFQWSMLAGTVTPLLTGKVAFSLSDPASSPHLTPYRVSVMFLPCFCINESCLGSKWWYVICQPFVMFSISVVGSGSSLYTTQSGA